MNNVIIVNNANYSDNKVETIKIYPDNFNLIQESTNKVQIKNGAIYIQNKHVYSHNGAITETFDTRNKSGNINIDFSKIGKSAPTPPTWEYIVIGKVTGYSSGDSFGFFESIVAAKTLNNSWPQESTETIDVTSVDFITVTHNVSQAIKVYIDE